MTDLTITVGKISIDLKEVYQGMKPWKIDRVKAGVESLLESVKKTEYLRNIGGIERGYIYASGHINITLNPEKEKRIRVRFPNKDYIYEVDEINFSIKPPKSHRDFIRVEVSGEFSARRKYFNKDHEVSCLIHEEVVKPLIWEVERRRKKSDPQEWMKKEIKRLRGEV